MGISRSFPLSGRNLLLLGIFFVSFVLASCTFDMAVNDRSAGNGSENPNNPISNQSPSIPNVCDSYEDYTGPTRIFRSVGPGSTSPIIEFNVNHLSRLTIVDSVAYFQKGVPDNVGVGDVLVMDTNGDGTVDTPVFLHCRFNSRQFVVRDAAGALVSDYSSMDRWQIFRAYTSLFNAEEGTINSGIPGSANNFDNWSNGKDLTVNGNDEVWNIVLYADAIDTTSVVFLGWDTDANHRLNIFSAFKPSEVGVSQRHNGRWESDRGYKLMAADDVLQFRIDFASVEGLQIQVSYSSQAQPEAISFIGTTNTEAEIQIRSNIIRGGPLTGSSLPAGIRINSTYGMAKISNNIIYNIDSGGGGNGIRPTITPGAYIYNNTVVACNIGISSNLTETVLAKNNIVKNNVNGFGGTFLPESDFNISDQNGDAPNVTFTGGFASVSFASESHNDFHLSSSDTTARGQGVNLSQDSQHVVTTDIDGVHRSSSWDIGADQSGQGPVQPVYASLANWNDYVKSDSGELACTPASDSECEHSGLMKVFDLPTESSCAGFWAEDNVEAIEWRCDDSSGHVQFVSSELKESRGLADLINYSVWKPMSLKIGKLDQILYESVLEPWWSNPIAELPDNSSGSAIVLDGVDDDGGGPDQIYMDGTVFVLSSSRATNGYNINLDKASLITMDNAVLNYGDDINSNCAWTGELGTDLRTLLCMGYQDHIWLEGNFDGASGGLNDAERVVKLTNIPHSKFRRVFIENGIDSNMSIASSSDHIEVSLSEFNNSQIGLEIATSVDSHVHDIKASGNIDAGVNFNFASNHLFENSEVFSNADGLELYTAQGVEVRNIHSHGNTSSGIWILETSVNNVLYNLKIEGNSGDGILITNSSDGNLIYKSQLINNGQDGIRVWTNSNKVIDTVTSNNTWSGIVFRGNENIAVGILSANNGIEGVHLDSGVGHVVQHLTAVSNGGNAGLFGQADELALVNMVFGNNSGYGLRFDNSDNDVIHQFLAANNQSNGFSIQVSDNNILTGEIFMGSHGGNDCMVQSGTGNNWSGTPCVTVDPNLNFHSGVDLIGHFSSIVGEDSLNADIRDLGVINYLDFSNITDWFNFDSKYRTWGLGADQNPMNSFNRGECGSGNCAIWDWRTALNENLISNYFGEFQEEAVCPSSVDGDQVFTDKMTSPNIFLLSAMELVSDDIGDNDGLCESNEACLFVPHMGGVLDEGDLAQAKTCQFQDGIVTGVTMYGF